MTQIVITDRGRWDSGAHMSDCGRYRYRLWRVWGARHANRVCWIMLNPSTATAEQDDPTIRRCVTFAKAWGFHGIEVVNLFGLRSPRPQALVDAIDPVGPANDNVLVARATSCPLVIAAWGQFGKLLGRGSAAKAILARQNVALRCLGLTKAGYPRHPLYVRSDVRPMPFGEKGSDVS